MTDSKDWGAAIHNHYGEQLHKLQEEVERLRAENDVLRSHLGRVTTWVHVFGVTYKELGGQLDAALAAQSRP